MYWTDLCCEWCSSCDPFVLTVEPQMRTVLVEYVWDLIEWLQSFWFFCICLLIDYALDVHSGSFPSCFMFKLHFIGTVIALVLFLLWRIFPIITPKGNYCFLSLDVEMTFGLLAPCVVVFTFWIGMLIHCFSPLLPLSSISHTTSSSLLFLTCSYFLLWFLIIWPLLASPCVYVICAFVSPRHLPLTDFVSHTQSPLHFSIAQTLYFLRMHNRNHFRGGACILLTSTFSTIDC